MQYLATKGKSFTYLDAKDPDNERTVTELRKEGIQTVPQIWLDHERIGGYDELVKRI
jgi:glutaredoxin